MSSLQIKLLSYSPLEDGGNVNKVRTSEVRVEDSMKSSQTFLLHILLIKLSVAGLGWQECDDRN